MLLKQEMKDIEDILLINSINNSLKLLNEQSKRLKLYVNKYFPVEENFQEEKKQTKETKVRRIV